MRTAAIIGGLLLVGCGRASSTSDGERASGAASRPRAVAPEPQEGFVVLAPSTALHRRPSTEAPSFTFDPRVPGAFGDAYRAFEVVGRQGGWIRIRNLDAQAGAAHCVGGWEALEHFELAFWVREADLQRVTRRPVVETFGDGTRVKLAAGVPVRAADGQWTALGPGASAQLPLPENAVGVFYQPSAPYRPKAAQGSVPPDAGLLLGGRPLDGAMLVRDGAIPTYGRGDGEVATVGTRCAELQVIVRGQAEPREDLDAAIAEREAILRGIDEASGQDRWTFEAGAEVFWDDGERAGELVGAHAFDRAPSLDSDRRCFAHAGLVLCLRADDMKELPGSAG